MGFPTNAVLVFRVSTGGLVTDPNTGNVYPANSRAVTIQAKLVRTEKLPDYVPLPGLDTTGVYLDGHCVNPISLPSGIKTGAMADCTLEGRPGTFVLDSRAQSPYGTNRIVGQRISGYFQEQV